MPPNFFSDLMMGLSQASNQLPQAMAARQQASQARQRLMRQEKQDDIQRAWKAWELSEGDPTARTLAWQRLIDSGAIDPLPGTNGAGKGPDVPGPGAVAPEMPPVPGPAPGPIPAPVFDPRFHVTPTPGPLQTSPEPAPQLPDWVPEPIPGFHVTPTPGAQDDFRKRLVPPGPSIDAPVEPLPPEDYDYTPPPGQDPRLTYAIRQDLQKKQEKELKGRVKWSYSREGNFFWNPNNPEDQKPGPEQKDLINWNYSSDRNFFWNPEDPVQTIPGPPDNDPKEDDPESWEVHRTIPHALLNKNNGEVRFVQELKDALEGDISEEEEITNTINSLLSLRHEPVLMTQQFHKLGTPMIKAIMSDGGKDAQAVMDNLRVVLGPGATNIIADGDTALRALEKLKLFLGTTVPGGEKGETYGKRFEPGLAPLLKWWSKGDTDIHELDSLLRVTRQIVGKFLEGGVLRREDEIKYERMLPFLGTLEIGSGDFPWIGNFERSDTLETALRKLKHVTEMLSEKQAQYKEIAGYQAVVGSAEEIAEGDDRKIFNPNTATKYEFLLFIDKHGGAENATEMLDIYNERFGEEK